MIKGENLATASPAIAIPKTRRLHRLQRRSQFASTRSSQNLGPDLTETAPKPLSRIGVATEVSERIFFVTASGPTSASKLTATCASVSAPKHSKKGMTADAEMAKGWRRRELAGEFRGCPRHRQNWGLRRWSLVVASENQHSAPPNHPLDATRINGSGSAVTPDRGRNSSSAVCFGTQPTANDCCLVSRLQRTSIEHCLFGLRL